MSHSNESFWSKLVTLKEFGSKLFKVRDDKTRLENMRKVISVMTYIKTKACLKVGNVDVGLCEGF